jgi:tRNA nucleotidyltransferase (CCA-adding enzyme)
MFPVEVTTFRIDGVYSDNRRPDTVTYADAGEADLSRRDFTVNAMAYSEKTGLVDLYGGEEDLFTHTIRCVGNPSERFDEDALRILRALRFAATLQFSIEQHTANCIHQKAALLHNISKERISKELTRLLCGKNAGGILTDFADVFTEIIPEIAPCIGFEQNSKYHIYDVWEHTTAAIKVSQPDKYVRLALLFHDIAKPVCYRQDENGSGHFSGHEKIGAQMAESILKELKFDNKTIETVCKLVRYHYITPVASKRAVKKLLAKVGYPLFEPLMQVVKADNLAKHTFCFERADIADEMLQIASETIKSGECFTLSMLEIDGSDLTAKGLRGRNVGRILDILLGEVIDEKTLNKHELLNERADEISRELQISNARYG